MRSEAWSIILVGVMLGLFRPYINDCRGNFAMTLAFASMLISLVVGVGVDTNGAVRQARHLQNIADAAALAASKSLEQNPEDIKAIVIDVVENNNTEMYGIESDVTVLEASIKVRLTSEYETIILKSIGRPTIKTSVVSISPMINSDPINVSLVLDTTVSMAGANMNALKTAVNEFVDTLERVNNDDIMISIVPYAQYITVPLHYRNQPWLDVPADYVQTFPTTCVWDGQKQVCHTPDPIHWVWKGVVAPRKGTAKVQNEFGGNRIPGILEPRDGGTVGSKVLLEPTKDYRRVRNHVDSMSTKGLRHIPSGLMWGWRTISPNEPIAATSKNQNEKVINAIVLLTDGESPAALAVRNKYDNGGKKTDTISETMCSNIKSEGLVVYTITYKFEPTSVDTKQMIQSCASKPENYFEVSNSAQLRHAFKSIAVALYTSRLSG